LAFGLNYSIIGISTRLILSERFKAFGFAKRLSRSIYFSL